MNDEFDFGEYDGEHEDHEQAQADLAFFREKMEVVEDVARKMGLYVRDAGMTVMPDFASGGPRKAFVANFTVGDVAWSDRVQNPAQDATESEFRQLAAQAEREKFEEMKAEMERKLAEGKGIFDDREDAGEEDGEDGPKQQ